ncbi:MAG: metal-dependent transcriptional regulator [Deltaproteobacteria bacterium]|nr:metal-dependent transcriptional regulator [Deltaproteobacteria bacterium]
MADNKTIEEILEFIWSQREAGKDSIKELLKIEEIVESGGGMETLHEIERDGLIETRGDEITLTRKGERLAEAAIRRHRLAERLLSEVLELDAGLIERNACNFEHSLTSVVTDSICTLLGHPPTCPHGLPIPRGECCRRFRLDVKPLVQPLADIQVGEKGRIVFIIPSSHPRLDRLGSLGVVPGSIVRLHQRQPSFVIEIGETTLAIDPEIAKEIYVKKEVQN